MPGAVLTPFCTSPVELAEDGGRRLWWKKLLPVGTIRYKGRDLHFTRQYNDRLAATYLEGAYDQVPLQLADADNTHTNAVERFGGDIVGMRSTADGLWVAVSPTGRGEQILLENPRLGVSARIVEDYERADGKFFPAAIQHVLATLDPRVPHLGPWRAIEAASEPEITIDLSGEQFTEEGKGAGTMPELTTEQQGKLARLLSLPEDQFSQLVDGLTAPMLTDDELAQLTGETGGSQPDELSDDDIAQMVADMSPEEFASLEASFQQDMQAAGTATGLTADAAMAIEMANANADEAYRSVSVIQAQLDRQHFEAEKRRLADAGVPPYITEMGRQLLEGDEHTVDLANGQSVDAGHILRRILTEVGKVSGMLDLGAELGSPMDEPAQLAAGEQARAELVGRYKAMTGLR